MNISRAYTPILYYLSPPVVYSGSDVSFFIDPRLAQGKKSAVFPELPFTDVRINQFGVDFEDFIDETTVLEKYKTN